jgi:hypothetical protein
MMQGFRLLNLSCFDFIFVSNLNTCDFECCIIRCMFHKYLKFPWTKSSFSTFVRTTFSTQFVKYVFKSLNLLRQMVKRELHVYKTFYIIHLQVLTHRDIAHKLMAHPKRHGAHKSVKSLCLYLTMGFKLFW